MIHVKNISKSFWHDFKRTQVLKDVSFSVKKGEVFGFLGPNGAGKTTTIKLLIGLLRPEKGEILIDGYKPTDLDIKKKIGYLPEDPYFYQYLTGMEFLHFCGELFRLPSDILKKRTHKTLKEVGLLEEKNKLLKYYSRGMLQRIGIAQCLINNPSILFLDEPLSGLDPIGRKEVKDIILKLKKEKKTIFFSTHILNDIEQICDSIAIINKGLIIKQGNLKTLIKTDTLEEYFIKTIEKIK